MVDGIDRDINWLKERNEEPGVAELESFPLLGEHKALVTVLDGLFGQIMNIRANIEAIKAQPCTKHQTFGSGLSEEQRFKISNFQNQSKQEKTVSLEHALVLVKHLTLMKTSNMELDAQVKELRAKLSDAGVQVSASAAQAAPPQEDTEEEDSDSDVDYTDSDDETPIEGDNLLEQMLNCEMQTQKNALGISQKTKTRSKPLAAKAAAKNDLSKSSRPDMQAKKFDGASNNNTQATTSNTSSKKKTAGRSKVISEQRQQQAKLFKVVQQAFQIQILDDPAYEDPLQEYLGSQREQIAANNRLSVGLQSTELPSNTATQFEKVRAHFNCLQELEASHGLLNDASRLREVLRQTTFQLGLENHNNKSIWYEMTTLKKQKDRLREDKIKLEVTKETAVEELTQHKSKLYDIEYDDY